MKILIISLPRTGSTSLLYKIAKEKNLKPIFEPFDGSGRVLYNNQDNIVVKTIICQHNNNIELSKNFDEIILLSRKNLEECIESHAHQVYFSKTEDYNSNEHYKYKKPPDDVIRLCSDNIYKWNEEIQLLSKELKTPVLYYEDIFDKNSSGRLRLIQKNKTKII